MKEIVNNILSVTADSFKALALQVFRLQYQQNVVYRQWVNALKVQVDQVTELHQIPFLPVSFFKSNKIVTGQFTPEIIFESSTTSGSEPSKHYVADLGLYTRSFTAGFQRFYGDPKQFCIIGLLPSYLERNGSSLTYMVQHLVQQSQHPQSGFYLYEFNKLAATLQQLEAQQQKTLLIGVTFALLDFAASYPMSLQFTTVMETGGMKGRRKEMLREEVHQVLQQSFQLPAIHSEYGMTELFSQAYSAGNGLFTPVPWLKLLIRDEDDPLLLTSTGRGLINVIDLANVHSCSFIATDDVARLYPNGNFEVLGRRDNSDIRGCSLMFM